MRMRWFLGGFGLGCLVGGLAVWALVPAPEAGDAPESSSAPSSGGVVAAAPKDDAPVGAHRAPAAGAAAPGSGAARAGAPAGEARGEERTGRAAPPERASEAPSGESEETGLRLETSEWTFGPGDATLESGDIVYLDVRGSSGKFTISASGWSPSADTRTRDHVKSLLDQERWGSPAPLQDGPSGAARLLAACHAAAAEHLAAGGDSSAETALALLDSPDPNATATAIGLAYRGRFADVLAAAARAPASGAYRYAAALSISTVCRGDESAAEAVIALTRSEDVDLRGLAEAILSRLGERGSDAAADRLIAGDFHEPDLVGLAPAAMAGPRRLEVLTSLRDPMALLACCAALRGADWGSEEMTQVRRRLPALLTPLFSSAAGQEWVGFAADLLAEVEPDALTAIAGDADVPLRARLVALDAALDRAATPEAVLDVATAVLRSGDLPRDVFGTILGRLDDETIRSPSFGLVLRGLVARSRDPWTREDARRTLQRSLPRESGDLRILSAVYGADGKIVDVADALRARCALGCLVETAGNHLGGDPLRGTGKILRIEYALGARRHVQEVPEGQAFHLP